MKYTISIWGIMSYVLVRLESNYDGLGYSMNMISIIKIFYLYMHTAYIFMNTHCSFIIIAVKHTLNSCKHAMW